ncbi:MAG: aldo/keto reductase [Planctomycetota bacterium]
MRSNSLGRDGLQVSEIGFGSWALGGQWGPQSDADSVEALRLAIDQGVTLIDTAPGYGDGRSESVIAEVMHQLSPDQRDSICLATKSPPAEGPWPPSPYCRWQDRYSASYLRDNVEKRLRSLGVETLDLLQLHSWTRAWNDDPQPLLILQRLCQEGKIRRVGICTPEQDQNCVIQLMRDGLVDVVQVVFNLFEQEPAAQLLPVAEETGTGVLVRVSLDEGALTGKWSRDHAFDETDYRQHYFAGDRLPRTLDRVDAIQHDLADLGLNDSHTLGDVAIKFAAAPSAVSSVIVGMRTVAQVQANLATAGLPDLSSDVLDRLRHHQWRRGVWYAGK